MLGQLDSIVGLHLTMAHRRIKMNTWEFPTKNDDIAIVAVIDASGSMAHLLNDTLGGFNNFKRQQAEQPGKAYMSVTTFNTFSNVLYSSRDISEVPDLTSREYSPSGGTALLDAVGKTIIEVSKSKNLPEKVLFLIITDGEENSSYEFTKSVVKRLIDEKTEKGWQFIYLGANTDKWAANSIGINTFASYVPTAWGTANLYNTVSSNATLYRSSSVEVNAASAMNWEGTVSANTNIQYTPPSNT
jgi:uncharacterized protein YegL